MVDILPQVLETPRAHQPKSSKMKRMIALVAALAVVGTIATVAVISTQNANKAHKLSHQVHTTSYSTSGSAATGGFLDVHLDESDSSALLLTIPQLSLNTPFVIHSTFNKGSAPDSVTGDGEMGEERSSPAIDQSWQWFHFELAEDGQHVHVVRDNYVTRTTDAELEFALKEGLWTGYVDTLAILETTDKQEYIVSALSMATKGFYVSTYLSGAVTFMKEHTRAFVENTNFLVEYHGEKTYSMFFSLLRLPETVMPARVADDRVGYFSHKYQDLGMHPKVSAKQSRDIDRVVEIINRRRLEKDSVTGETIKPIVYYIDPSVPLRWRAYFKQGVEIWNQAFQAAGFKNAIKAVLPTDCDFPADFHVGDMRYTTISTMISPAIYARGPMVIDPRSGEILHSDITFAHGWVNSWTSRIGSESPFVPKTKATLRSTAEELQCHIAGSSEDQIQAALFGAYSEYTLGSVSDETIGAAFRATVMHEVGHTIGLRHNFIASLARSEEQLKDAEYSKLHGLSASVMDYVPANIWSDMTQEQAESNVFFSTVLGEYDLAAINYGYSVVEDEVSSYTNEALDTLAKATPNFATDEDKMSNQNPYAYTFDMAQDPIGYYLDRMELIRTLRKNMIDRYVLDGDSWTRLWSTESYFLRLTDNIVQNLARFIGGVSINHQNAHRYNHSSAPVVQYVSREDSTRVLEFALQVVANAKGIFPPKETYSMYLERNGNCELGMSSYCYATKVADVDALVQTVRKNVIQHLLNPEILQRLVMEEAQAHLSVRELLTSVMHAVFSDPTNVSNFNVQNKLMEYITVLAKADDQRIANEAVLVMMLIKSSVHKIMEDPSLLPPEAYAHFLTIVGPAFDTTGSDTGSVSSMEENESSE